MKVLIVNPIIYTSETADIKRVPSIKDTMIYDLCLAFQKKGHTVTLLAGDVFRPTNEESYPFEIIWAKCVLPKICRPNVLPYCPEIKQLIKKESYDLIISSEVFSLNSLMLARRCHGNLVIWHELAKHNRLLHELPSRLWYGLVARTFFKNTPVIARSREAREFISQFCKNVSADIIDHGVNGDKFAPCCDKEDYFVVSSQLIERKQIDKIITAFGRFAAAHPSYRLYIFGEGDQETALKEQCRALGLEASVTFFGKVPHEELKDYLRHAAAMLVYTKQDNNMVSIVESIACATPVITTGVPYNASYIRANGLGIVNDHWDEHDLETVCQNQKQYIDSCLAYREQLSAEGKVAQFTKGRGGKQILLSSYSVNPYHGSEDGIGWNWTLQAAKHFNHPGDTVYLVTKKVNEADTRRGIEEAELKNVQLVISDTPDWLNWYREHRSVFHHLYYILWQAYAYRWAKSTGISFDIIHHVTMVDFRIPGFLWKMKTPYTIFGPVGGGQSTPGALKDYEKSKAVEKFRETVNRVCAILPYYKKAIRRFDRVFAINKETEAYMEKALGSGCSRLTELALAKEFRALVIAANTESDVVRLLYLGRLIEKKGLMLLLDVIAAMDSSLPFTLEIYGEGPLEAAMKTFINAHQLENKVKLCGAVAHTQVSSAYRNADIFIMPSLRETSGNVLVEAMAHQLPIVALDMSVCSDFKVYDCGLFVDTDQGKEAIIEEFAQKLTYLIQHPEERVQMGQNGYRFVNEALSWEKKFETVYKDLYKDESR